MSKPDYQTLTQIFSDAVDILTHDGHQAYVHPHYSGKFMYGAQIPAISANCSGTLVGIAIQQAAQAYDDIDLAHTIPTRMDEFGKGHVYY